MKYISNGIHMLQWLKSHIQLLLHELCLVQALCSSSRLSVMLSWTPPGPVNASPWVGSTSQSSAYSCRSSFHRWWQLALLIISGIDHISFKSIPVSCTHYNSLEILFPHQPCLDSDRLPSYRLAPVDACPSSKHAE